MWHLWGHILPSDILIEFFCGVSEIRIFGCSSRTPPESSGEEGGLAVCTVDVLADAPDAGHLLHVKGPGVQGLEIVLHLHCGKGARVVNGVSSHILMFSSFSRRPCL